MGSQVLLPGVFLRFGLLSASPWYPGLLSAPGGCSCLGLLSARPWCLSVHPQAGSSSGSPGSAGEAPGQLCAQSLRPGSSAFQPFQKEFSISSFSSSRVCFSVFVLWLLLREGDSKVHLKVQKINVFSPLNFQNSAKGF